MENKKNNVIPMFGRAATLVNEGQTKPHLGAFLNEIGVDRERSPITAEVLKRVFEAGCTSDFPEEAFVNFQDNVAHYKKRKEDVVRRASLAFPKEVCKDGVLAVAFDFMACGTISVDQVSEGIVEQVREAASHFRDFMVDGCPTQKDFDELTNTEQFLVAECLLDSVEGLTGDMIALDWDSEGEVKSVKVAQETILDKYKQINYGACGHDISDTLRQFFLGLERNIVRCEDRLDELQKPISKAGGFYFNQ